MYTSGIARLLASGVQSLTNIKNKESQLEGNVSIGRVTDVCLNSNSELFDGWNSIGLITFQELKSPTPTQEQNKISISTALPLLPQIKDYPLVDEFVLLFRGPSTTNPQTSGGRTLFYLPINLWNSQHYNGYPSPLEDNPEDQNTNYADILAGIPFIQSKKKQSVPLNGKSGGQFVEKGDVHPIIPFAGDNIVEGRNGNSIRLGSTANTDGEIQNNWSENSEEGDPILIIRNGQPASGSSEGFYPITEDINNDPSSAYFTSKQQIPIEVATEKQIVGEGQTIPFTSIIDKAPTSPKSYNDSQIILNSGRLLFNTIGDSILMSSQKSTIIEANEDIGIKSVFNNVNILAPKGNISMGQRNAKESVILGDAYMLEMKSLVKNLINVFNSLSKEPNLSLTPGTAQMAKNSLQEFLNKMEGDNQLLSDKVKVS